MTATLGLLLHWGAAVALVVAAVAALRRRDGAALVASRTGALLAAGAVATLAWALATGDFTMAYVAAVTDRATSWPYRLAGLWGGMGGSLLVWSTSWPRGAGAVRRPGWSGRRCAGLAAAFLADRRVVGHALARARRPGARRPRRHADPAPPGDALPPADPLPRPHRPGRPVGRDGRCRARRPRRRALGGACCGASCSSSSGVLTVGMVAGAHWAYVELGGAGSGRGTRSRTRRCSRGSPSSARCTA